MTQTELGEYMKDIQSEIEDSYPGVSCVTNEFSNGYGRDRGWWINITNVTNSDKYGLKNVVQTISSRVDMLFDLDLGLELISGWIGDRSIRTRWDRRFTDWDQMKIDMVDYRGWRSMEITIGKLQRKIKKFESFI